MTSVHGQVHPRFLPVKDELRRSLANGSERGCSIAVWHDGQLVVDLWAGVRDTVSGMPFEEDTLTTMFSVTKGMVSLCFLILADEGRFDYDAPVSTYWPAFAASDKRAITGRMLLNHRAGLLGFREPITIEMLERSPDDVVALLERTRPVWEPGTSQGYHAVSFGLYAGELFRRITGETVGAFFARRVAEPLGADVHIGLPEALERRTSRITGPTLGERLRDGLPAMGTAALLGRPTAEGRILASIVRKGESWLAFAEPHELGVAGIDAFNGRRVRALELPWANGMGTARGLCRVYTALANGGTLDGKKVVSPSALTPLRERQSWSSRDRVLQRTMGWTQGFVKEGPGVFSTTSTTSFGHPGVGGALGWCDPDRKLAIGYLTVNMAQQVRSPRALALCRVIDACVGA